MIKLLCEVAGFSPNEKAEKVLETAMSAGTAIRNVNKCVFEAPDRVIDFVDYTFHFQNVFPLFLRIFQVKGWFFNV